MKWNKLTIDTTTAAVLGVLFGVFAVLGYLIAGKKS